MARGYCSILILQTVPRTGPSCPDKGHPVQLGNFRIIRNSSCLTPSSLKLINTAFIFPTLYINMLLLEHFLQNCSDQTFSSCCWHEQFVSWMMIALFVVSPGHTVILLTEIWLKLTGPIWEGKHPCSSQWILTLALCQPGFSVIYFISSFSVYHEVIHSCSSLPHCYLLSEVFWAGTILSCTGLHSPKQKTHMLGGWWSPAEAGLPSSWHLILQKASAMLPSDQKCHEWGLIAVSLCWVFWVQLNPKDADIVTKTICPNAIEPQMYCEAVIAQDSSQYFPRISVFLIPQMLYPRDQWALRTIRKLHGKHWAVKIAFCKYFFILVACLL